MHSILYTKSKKTNKISRRIACALSAVMMAFCATSCIIPGSTGKGTAALFLMLYQLIYSYISNNKSYYGMLIANGILKNDLIAISLAESLSILIAACIAASQFSALLLKFIS